MGETRRYRPELDGIRAVAIGGVVATHLHLRQANGGALGVDVFFVLSGYLITGILLAEHQRTGRVGLKSFYIRRALRLFPALLAFVCIGGFFEALVTSLRAGTIAVGSVIAVTYVTDIVTYFHQASHWIVYGHLWSLAIEEHFYLLWPAVLVLMLRRRTNPKVVLVVAALALTVVAGICAQPAASGPNILPPDYFQPQAHAFAIVAGCALAFFSFRPWVRHLAMPCLVGIVVLMATWSAASTLSYLRFAVPLTALLTCGLIAGLENGGVTARVLSWAPVRHVGVISYGLYVYHQLVFLVVLHYISVGQHVEQGLELLAALVVTEISYYFLESPIRAIGRRPRPPAAAPSPETSTSTTSPSAVADGPST